MNLNQLTQFSNQSIVLQKIITAASLNIFMNYSQTITIINSLDLNWENQMLEIFNIYRTVSGGFQQIVSIECFFTGSPHKHFHKIRFF